MTRTPEERRREGLQRLFALATPLLTLLAPDDQDAWRGRETQLVEEMLTAIPGEVIDRVLAGKLPSPRDRAGGTGGNQAPPTRPEKRRS
jgi:hypothetical protein